MYILGIESSCDETAASIVKDGSLVLSSIVASQIDIHSKFGGVIPEIAAREHLKNIDVVVSLAIKESGISLKDIGAIAVTQGPGLIGALLVGISYAKGMALSLGVDLIPVDHVHAHIHAALLKDKDDNDSNYNDNTNYNDIFPCLALAVSGGHTNLYYMKDFTSYKLISHSLDDACGECFDKVAKLLGLGYPGGKIIEDLAKEGDPKKYPMPTVTTENKLMFSYSGIKTHMVHLLNDLSDEEKKNNLKDICACFQEVALNQVVKKIMLAKKLYPDTKTVLVAGGVSANQRFRYLLKNHSIKCFSPKLKYCGDNAAMIAALGYRIFNDNLKNNTLNFKDYSWDAYSRYGFEKYL